MSTKRNGYAGVLNHLPTLAVTGLAAALLVCNEILRCRAERYASEHLDEDEYGKRHTIAWRARTRRDLRAAVRGLPW